MVTVSGMGRNFSGAAPHASASVQRGKSGIGPTPCRPIPHHGRRLQPRCPAPPRLPPPLFSPARTGQTTQTDKSWGRAARQALPRLAPRMSRTLRPVSQRSVELLVYLRGQPDAWFTSWDLLQVIGCADSLSPDTVTRDLRSTGAITP